MLVSVTALIFHSASPIGGAGVTDQRVPFQCSINGLMGPSDEPNDPTAHAFDGDSAATSYSETKSAAGRGTGTLRHGVAAEALPAGKAASRHAPTRMTLSNLVTNVTISPAT